MMTRKSTKILRPSSSLTTNSVKTSRRSSFHAQSIGSPAKLCSLSKGWTTSTKTSLKTKMMKMRTMMSVMKMTKMRMTTR